jgi:serine/threonine protein kinase
VTVCLPGARRARDRGECFGLYTLREQLGEGATCAVFAAEHRDARKPLAIKVLHHRLLGDPATTERMLHEARMIAALHHPGIIEVFDVGYSTAGRPFVVLERLVGEPLSTRLERGPVSETRIASFARQLASALEVAHRDGIVHRDLKPENIYIIADPASVSGERIKILDFGIAKHDGFSGDTATGIVLGTPAYMAPEQARMRQLDGRADIYALGIVMYVMATGILPFTGANTDEILAEHAHCAPVPPAALANITPALSAIIERCLAKRPEDRYPRMRDVAFALAGVETLHHTPERRVHPVRSPRARRFWRRLGALVIPAAIAILVAAAVGVGPRAREVAPPADGAAPPPARALVQDPAVQRERPAPARPARTLPATTDRARPAPRRPASFVVKRAASPKPPPATRSAAQAPLTWDPDALWLPITGR